jgi:dinuclear metal center YbgI/SA1388 family protein
MSPITINDIISGLEKFAPLAYQESYDNCGLLTGDRTWRSQGALLSLDCTEEVVDEAIGLGCNLIISHHPVIFSGLKKLTGTNYVERTIIKAIQNNIAIYACHTNIDNVHNGVNHRICEKLGLKNLKILSPKTGLLKKLVTYVPRSHHEKVLDALFAAGAGKIGNYDSCSFNLEGTGTFRGNEQSQPFVGKAGELSRENETRIETIFGANEEAAVKKALLSNHPYEEVAYDIYAMSNHHPQVGSGMTGSFESEMTEEEFLKHVKKTFRAGMLKHTVKTGRKIKKVAVCGGSGRFLLKDAIKAGADAFITADFKYHEYFDAEGRLLLVDVGHNETEQFTPEIFYDVIRKNFATFAIHLSKINTNPVNYF